jgi:hypothetical protein
VLGRKDQSQIAPQRGLITTEPRLAGPVDRSLPLSTFQAVRKRRCVKVGSRALETGRRRANRFFLTVAGRGVCRFPLLPPGSWQSTESLTPRIKYPIH